MRQDRKKKNKNTPTKLILGSVNWSLLLYHVHSTNSLKKPPRPLILSSPSNFQSPPSTPPPLTYLKTHSSSS